MPNTVRNFVLAAMLSAPLIWAMSDGASFSLIDFPNHLVKAEILENIWQGGALGKFFELRPLIPPYESFDALYLFLRFFFSGQTSESIIISAIVVLPTLGAVCLSRHVSGRVSMVAWAAVFVGFNSVVRWGFFNYLPAIYLVPFALIAWDRFWLKRQSLDFIFYFALSLACYFGHFFSFFCWVC